MANRAYLYSADQKPAGATAGEIDTVGLSEFEWDIPVVYKILLSAGTEAVDSTIFPNPEKEDEPLPVALAADYQRGLNRLALFFDDLKEHIDPEVAAKTLAFLRDPKNARKYFLLEAAEVYALQADSEEDLIAENNTMRLILSNPGIMNPDDDAEIAKYYSDEVLEEIEVYDTDTIDEITDMEWSNHLYYS